ncbi:hypothetical protein AXG93_2309s1000 [Marchantia polymorpha subsp. ruderalis]|uniref:Protein kinase domain-containing protein n=1 Tax=Marchantia polymorpha subsp. ruderalis TaxID=1480154 RepID=A0A176VR58_MARPO|nr:hypothetical protein AXG93_2309s1000 [Marchantia polymorpha subsp. ruderalis]
MADHSQYPATTQIAGTFGYIAPEVAGSGKFTDKTDVYAFGAVALVIACGRPAYLFKAPVEQIFLVDWVWEKLDRERLFDVVDPRLGEEFDAKEMKLLLLLGLLCSHPNAGSRPTMREVVEILGDRCFASEQVLFEDSTSSQEPLAQEKSGEEPLAQGPSDRAGEAGPPEARSPTALEILAESGAAVAAPEATRSSSKESPRIFVAIEILDSEDEEDEDLGSEGQEVESVQGSPTGVLCEQVVPLLRYLDRKAAEAHREFEKQREKIKAELNSERAQNCILVEELVQ